MGSALPHKVGTAEHKDIRQVGMYPCLHRLPGGHRLHVGTGAGVPAGGKRVVMMRLCGSMWEEIIRGADDS